jgi:hypothetical protein
MDKEKLPSVSIKFRPIRDSKDELEILYISIGTKEMALTGWNKNHIEEFLFIFTRRYLTVFWTKIHLNTK